MDPFTSCIAVESLGICDIRITGRSFAVCFLDETYDNLLTCVTARLLALVGVDVRHRCRRIGDGVYEGILVINRFERAMFDTCVDAALHVLNTMLQAVDFDTLCCILLACKYPPNCGRNGQAIGYLRALVRARERSSRVQRNPEQELGIARQIFVNPDKRVAFVGLFPVRLNVGDQRRLKPRGWSTKHRDNKSNSSTSRDNRPAESRGKLKQGGPSEKRPKRYFHTRVAEFVQL